MLAEEGTGHKSLWAPQDSIWNEEEELGAVPVIVQQLQDEVLQAKIQCQQEKSRCAVNLQMSTFNICSKCVLHILCSSL